MVLNYVDHSQNEVQFTINTGAKVHTRKLKADGTFSLGGHICKPSIETRTITVLDKAVQSNSQTPLTPLTEAQSEFDINERFAFLDQFVNMTLSNITSSLLICGQSGLGKSHTVLEILDKNNLEEDADYVIIKGYATPKALYATLYENKDKVVIFDDCDSVLKDPVSLNILKGALDSYAKRTISWLSKGFIDDGLPSSFDFEGQVIFISNISLPKIDKAVRGRTLAVDVTMSIQDRIDRMKAIVTHILPDYDLSLKEEVLEFIDEHKFEAKELNMRTFEKLIKVAFSYSGNPMWKDAAKYILTNA